MRASDWGIHDSDLVCWIVGLACMLIFVCTRMWSKWRTWVRTKLFAPPVVSIRSIAQEQTARSPNILCCWHMGEYTVATSYTFL